MTQLCDTAAESAMSPDHGPPRKTENAYQIVITVIISAELYYYILHYICRRTGQGPSCTLSLPPCTLDLFTYENG